MLSVYISTRAVTHCELSFLKAARFSVCSDYEHFVVLHCARFAVGGALLALLTWTVWSAALMMLMMLMMVFLQA